MFAADRLTIVANYSSKVSEIVGEGKDGKQAGKNICRVERSDSGGGRCGGIFSARDVQSHVSAGPQYFSSGERLNRALGGAGEEC